MADYSAHRRELLDGLRSEVSRVVSGGRSHAGILPFGIQELDGHLPAGGLEIGALHEFTGGERDFSLGSAATLFAAGIAARHEGTVLWVMRRQDLFAPALSAVGLHPDRIIFAEARDTHSLLAAMEEGLRHGGLGAVVGEVDRLSLTASRRLHLAAEGTGTTALVVRRWWTRAEADRADHTASVTRWSVTSAPSEPLRTPGVGRARWSVDLLRCRNGDGGSWVVGGCDPSGRLATVGGTADIEFPRRAFG